MAAEQSLSRDYDDGFKSGIFVRYGAGIGSQYKHCLSGGADWYTANRRTYDISGRTVCVVVGPGVLSAVQNTRNKSSCRNGRSRSRGKNL